MISPKNEETEDREQKLGFRSNLSNLQEGTNNEDFVIDSVSQS